jgi:hypothetical protein
VPVHGGEKYAKTISGLLRTHKQICAQARGALDDNGKAGARTGTDTPWPNLRCTKLNTLCEALVIVFDDYKLVAAEKHDDGLRHYNDVARDQSIPWFE